MNDQASRFGWLLDFPLWGPETDGVRKIEFALADFLARSNAPERTWLYGFLDWQSKHQKASGERITVRAREDVPGIVILSFMRYSIEPEFGSPCAVVSPKTRQ